MLSKRLSKYMRRTTRPFLKHSYTHIDKQGTLLVDDNDNPILDERGRKQYVPANAIEGKKCLFLWQDVHIENEAGDTTNRVPVLYVRDDDTITVGDVVRNVMTLSEQVILESAFVETIDSTAEAGDSVLKVLTLSGAVTR